MRNFTIGQRVRCVRARIGLTLNNVYTVVKLGSEIDIIYTKNDNGRVAGFYQDRFAPASHSVVPVLRILRYSHGRF